ncbi:hypothetical protein ACOME3_003233 [Neoechinorhynchus agilis]
MMAQTKRQPSFANFLFDESQRRARIRQHLLSINIIAGIIFGLTCLSAGVMEQQADVRAGNIGNVYILANFLSSLASIAVGWQSRASSPAMFLLRDRLASCILGIIFISFFVLTISLNFREMLAATWREGVKVEAKVIIPNTMLFILLLHLPLGAIGLFLKITLFFFNTASVSDSYVAQVVFDSTIVLMALAGAMSRSLKGIAKIKMTLVDEFLQVLLAIGLLIYGSRLVRIIHWIDPAFSMNVRNIYWWYLHLMRYTFDMGSF